MEKKDYLTPSVEVVRVSIEKGFAASGGSVAPVNGYSEPGRAGMLNESATYTW